MSAFNNSDTSSDHNYLVPSANRYLDQSTNILIAGAFAFLFCLIPWESIWIANKRVGFVDKTVYLQTFSDSSKLVYSYRPFDSLTSFISDEALWHYSVNGLLNIGVSIDAIFWALSFLTVFAFASVLVTRATPWSLLTLFNPIVVDLVCSQFRLGLAAGIMCLPFLVRNKGVAVLAVALATLIHTAVVVFGALYCVALVVSLIGRAKEMNDLFRAVLVSLLVCAGGLAAFVIGPWRYGLLLSMGDRRALQELEMVSSISYNSYWIFLLIGGLASGSRYCLRTDNAFSCTVLGLVAIGTFTNSYTSRAIGFAWPFLMTFLVLMPNPMRTIWLLAFVVYAYFQWLYWLSAY